MPEPLLYRVGEFTVDVRQRVLWQGGQMVVLPPKVFDTLHALVLRSGRVVEREELMNAIWADTSVEEGNLSVNISLLRKTLGKDAIETIPKRGYRFAASVQPLEDRIEPPATQAPAIPPVAPRGLLPWRDRRSAAIAVAAAGLALLLVSALYLRRARGFQPANSIAVMPFQNVSGDDATDYLSDGLSETLINTLSRLPGLKVIAQSSALRYKGKQIDPQEVGRQLDVQTLLMGRVAQRGADLVVNVELVDARDRTQIWGEQYSRKLNDILFVQSAVVQEVAARLRLQPGERGKAATGSPDAYQLYLKGRYFCAQWSPEGLQKGVQYFKQAIAVDPGYALAYDGLAYCYAVTDWWEPWRIASERARAFAKRALELDRSLSEAHTSLGIIATWLDYDWADAESEFKQAIALNPNSAAAHQWYGFLLLVVGRIEESIAQAKRAISLDPLSPETNSALGVYLFYAHRYDEALPPLRTAIELAPAYWFAHLYLARVQEQKGDLAGAVAGLEKAALMEGAAPEVTAALGYAYAAAGRRGDADKAIATLNQQSRQRYVPAYSYATVYAGLGDKDRAFAWLEKEMREGAYYAAFLGVDPEMDSLRPDPRFASLVRRLGVGPR